MPRRTPRRSASGEGEKKQGFPGKILWWHRGHEPHGPLKELKEIQLEGDWYTGCEVANGWR